MDDGTQLAIDVWLPTAAQRGEQVPTVLRLGRYWRDYDVPPLTQLILGRYSHNVSWLRDAGYAVVMVDVRGTGASFGVSTTPWSPREVADYPLVVDWVLAQPWSDGHVGAYGVSYDAVTSDWLAAANHPAVDAVLPAYCYSDVFLDVSHPGGILNDRFLQAWGELTYQMDRNDPDFLHILAAADPTGLLAQFTDLATVVLQGVEPVQSTSYALVDALAEHISNTHVYEATRQIVFRDDPYESVTIDSVSPLLGPSTHERAAAIRRVVGWLDAGTARGALRSFNTLDVDHHVVVITPENHTGNFRIDPYDFDEPEGTSLLDLVNEYWDAVPFFDEFMRPENAAAPRREVRYYTYGVNEWQTTDVWPPMGFEMQRWYFGADGTLTREAPTAADSVDMYKVDFAATTGAQNRWFTGLGGVEIRYVDRAEQDQRLLVYETPPFEQAMELTGHPVIHLKVRSTHDDGAFYAYLEEVTSEGRVVYLTEGQLRAIHRRVSTEDPPTAVFGPYHTYRRDDAWWLEPGEVAEITFDLLPISTVIQPGHRLRIALAGHDSDTFVRYPGSGTPTWTVERNATHASWIDIPLKPR